MTSPLCLDLGCYTTLFFEKGSQHNNEIMLGLLIVLSLAMFITGLLLDTVITGHSYYWTQLLQLDSILQHNNSKPLIGRANERLT